MIIDQVDPDTSGEFDFFSFAGRVALVGGGAYGVNKSMKEFNRTSKYASGPENDPFKRKMAEKLQEHYAGSLIPATEAEKVLFKQNNYSFGKLGGSFGKSVFKSREIGYAGADMDKFINKLNIYTGTSKYDYDARFGTYLKQVAEKYGKSGKNFKIEAFTNGDNIAQVDLTIGRDKISLNPRDRFGQRISGQGLNNREMVGGLVTGFDPNTGEAIIDSSASYQLKKILEDPSVMKNTKALQEQADKIAVYSGDAFSTAGAANLNNLNISERQRLERSKVSLAPDMNRQNKAFQLWAEKNKLNFGTAKSMTKGIVLMPDITGANPAASHIGQIESMTGPQGIRDTLVASYNGPAFNNAQWDTSIVDGKSIKRNTNQIKLNTLTLTDPAIQKKFMDAARELGVPLAALAEEEILFSDKLKGKFVDTSRSISVRADSLTPFMENLLDVVKGKSGIESTDDFMKALASEQGIGKVLAENNITMRDVFKIGERRLTRRIKDIDTFINEKVKVRNLGGNAPAGSLLAEQAQRAALEIDELRKQKSILRGGYKDLFNIGESLDTLSGVRYEDKLKDTIIRDMYYDPKTKGLKLALHREFGFDQGIKVHTPGGQAKRKMKAVAPLQEIFKKMGMTGMGGITSVAFHDMISDNLGKLSRNAPEIAFSLIENADKTTLDIARKFGVTAEGIDTARYGQADYRDFFKQVGFAHGATTEDEAVRKAISLAKADITGVGYVSSQYVGIEKHRFDMGAGQRATASSRQMMNLMSFGLDDMVDDVLGRRTDDMRSLLQAKELEKIQRTSTDKKIAGLSLTDDDRKKILSMYSGDFASVEEMQMVRNKVFDEYRSAGLLQDDKLVINLGKELDNRKLVISNSDLMHDFSGVARGSKGEFKNFTKLDNVIKKLLTETMTPEVRRNFLTQYDTQIALHKQTVGKKVLGGKINKSMYGQLESYAYGMDEYLASQKIKGNVVFMHEADIADKFGTAALKSAKSEAGLYAAFTREPAESIMSTMPVRVMSAEVAAESVGMHLLKKEGIIYTSATSELLKAMFGDFDGDMAAVIPFLKKSSGSQIKDFVDMNKKTRAGQVGGLVNFYQKRLAEGAATLKGRTGNDLLRTQAERMKMNQIAAEVSTGSIGKYSDKLSQVHSALRSELEAAGGMMSGDFRDIKRFLQGSAATHILIENILKAKHMTGKDLAEGRPQQIVDALLGEGAYTQADHGARSRIVEEFFDELVMGDNLTGYKTAVEEGLTGREAMVAAGLTMDEADEALKFKQSFASKDILANVVEMADQGKKMGIPRQAEEDFMQMLYNQFEGTSSSRAKRQVIKTNIEDTKRFAKGALKNFGLYGVLPLAAIGLVGSMATGPIEMDIERQYTDGKEELKPVSVRSNSGSVSGMRSAPKYREMNIKGDMGGSSRQFLDVMNNSSYMNNVRLTDHRANMDKYEIEEMVNKGY